MKYLLFILFSCSLVAHSQTADDIVNRYIEFTGGAENWKPVKTIITSGTYNYGGVEFPFISYSKAPNLYKYEVTFKGKSFTQSYNGESGWRIDGFNNETSKTILKGKQATAMANESEVELESPFINYKQKGHTILLQGTDTANSHTCYKILLNRKDGDSATYYFDNNDFSLVKKQAISKNTEMTNALMDIVYNNYQLTGNIKIPHQIICSTGGQRILLITVNTVKLNDPIADTVFQP